MRKSSQPRSNLLKFLVHPSSPTIDSVADLRLTEAALRIASPRLAPRKMPGSSRLIYGAIAAAWVLVVAGAYFFNGLLAWSVGLLYISYDTWLLAEVARRTHYLLKQPVGSIRQPVSPRPRPTIGIIVAAFNEAEALPRTLDALLAQHDRPEAILVVDDGSTDNTADVLRRHYGIVRPDKGHLATASLSPGLQVLFCPHAGKAQALNAGLAHLQTDVFVTVDADTLLDADAIAGMRAEFSLNPDLVAAGGVLTPVCVGGGFFQWFQTYEYIRAFISRVAWMRADALLLVSGAFAGFRRDAVLAVGGFDAACLVEDYELIHRLHRWSWDHGLNWKVGVLNSAQAVTDAPATLPSFLRQRRRWFAGFLQTQFWNRDLTANARYGNLGRLMMPIKAVDTLQPVYGLTAFLLLLYFLISGHPVFLPVLAVIGLKIVIDLGFHLWSVRLYAHWTGQKATRARFGYAALAALAEPFSFQLMRHSGAVWGWFAFLSGRHSWGGPATSTSRSMKSKTESST